MRRVRGFTFKLIQFVLSMLVLAAVVFFLSRLAPGDPLQAYYGENLDRIGLVQQEDARERLGLSGSAVSQFAGWAKAALSGDFGVSLKYKQDALSVVCEVIGNTVILMAASFLLLFALGLLLAIFCAAREGKLLDRIICRIGVAASSLPEFLVALLLILLFSVMLGILPSSGAYGIGESESFVGRSVHLILPVSAVVISHLWYTAYLMRNTLSEEMRKEYVLLLRVKGLPRGAVNRRCVKNVLPAAVSMMAAFLPHLLGGAYVVETVFSYPGLGSLGFESAKYHDYNMLMLVSLLTGAVVILVNMTAQALCERLDPRMKMTEEGGHER